VANLLGREGGGFVHLMERLPLERMSIAMRRSSPREVTGLRA
jgi:alkylation response protein AidB-like acyl-CoA dehydrogenase